LVDAGLDVSAVGSDVVVSFVHARASGSDAEADRYQADALAATPSRATTTSTSPEVETAEPSIDEDATLSKKSRVEALNSK